MSRSPQPSVKTKLVSAFARIDLYPSRLTSPPLFLLSWPTERVNGGLLTPFSLRNKVCRRKAYLNGPLAILISDRNFLDLCRIDPTIHDQDPGWWSVEQTWILFSKLSWGFQRTPFRVVLGFGTISVLTSRNLHLIIVLAIDWWFWVDHFKNVRCASKSLGFR